MLRKFLRDSRGSVLQIFAIALIPMLVATGGVIDYTNAFDQRSLVQDSLDAAALAAGKQVGLMTTDELREEAEAFFLANVGTTKITNIPELTTTITGSTVDVNTTLHVPTYFLGLIGLNEFIFNLHTQVTVAMGTIEIAMALDNSGSMSGSRIETLRTAAANLATTLHALGSTSTKPDPVKISLAPFAAAVNVGPGYAGADWMDTNALGTYHADAQKCYAAGGTVDSSGTCSVNVSNVTTPNNFTLFDSLKNADDSPISWGGCVEERPTPYDVTDDEPATMAYVDDPLFDPANLTNEQRKTLLVPMFAADDPDYWTCTTSLCTYSGTSSSNRRYNDAPGGTRTYNNYLPDAGGSCVGTAASGVGTVFTVSPVSNHAAVVTRANHGFSTADRVILHTTGALPSGLSAGTTYYVAPGSTADAFSVTTTSGSGSTFTVTTASPAVFARSSHGLTAGTALVFTTTGSLPTGLIAGTPYYVISSGLTTNNFQVSTTPGGSAVNTSGSQSPTHRYLPLVRTTGTSQSGTHNITNYWTCQTGNADCGGAGVGRTRQEAFGGLNLAVSPQCKYGTPANKATVSTIDIGGIQAGPNFMCSTTALTPLTTSLETITTAINAQQASGATNITAGLMWGWRTLSPGEPFTDGRSYADNENQKILVLMTDGANTYYPNSSLVKSWYGAWGYVGMGHLGTTSTTTSTLVTEMNARTAAACVNAKAAGITVYTIAFDVSDSVTLDMLETCATEPDMAFQSTSESELLAAFTAIGDDISLLRIAQ